MQNENIQLLERVEQLVRTCNTHEELSNNWNFVQQLREVQSAVADAMGTSVEALFCSQSPR